MWDRLMLPWEAQSVNVVRRNHLLLLRLSSHPSISSSRLCIITSLGDQQQQRERQHEYIPCRPWCLVVQLPNQQGLAKAPATLHLSHHLSDPVLTAQIIPCILKDNTNKDKKVHQVQLIILLLTLEKRHLPRCYYPQFIIENDESVTMLRDLHPTEHLKDIIIMATIAKFFVHQRKWQEGEKLTK